jgi:hypothetical protein
MCQRGGVESPLEREMSVEEVTTIGLKFDGFLILAAPSKQA